MAHTQMAVAEAAMGYSDLLGHLPVIRNRERGTDRPREDSFYAGVTAYLSRSAARRAPPGSSARSETDALKYSAVPPRFAVAGLLYCNMPGKTQLQSHACTANNAFTGGETSQPLA